MTQDTTTSAWTGFTAGLLKGTARNFQVRQGRVSRGDGRHIDPLLLLLLLLLLLKTGCSSPLPLRLHLRLRYHLGRLHDERAVLVSHPEEEARVPGSHLHVAFITTRARRDIDRRDAVLVPRRYQGRNE